MEKAIRPGEIATLVHDLADKGSDLGVVWRQLAGFLCISKGFLLVVERTRIELGELGYGGDQPGIDFQRLFKGCGSLFG